MAKKNADVFKLLLWPALAKGETVFKKIIVDLGRTLPQTMKHQMLSPHYIFSAFPSDVVALIRQINTQRMFLIRYLVRVSHVGAFVHINSPLSNSCSLHNLQLTKEIEYYTEQ